MANLLVTWGGERREDGGFLEMGEDDFEMGWLIPRYGLCIILEKLLIMLLNVVSDKSTKGVLYLNESIFETVKDAFYFTSKALCSPDMNILKL